MIKITNVSEQKTKEKQYKVTNSMENKPKYKKLKYNICLINKYNILASRRVSKQKTQIKSILSVRKKI